MSRLGAAGVGLVLLAAACSDSSTPTTATRLEPPDAVAPASTTTIMAPNITGTSAPAPTGTTEPPGVRPLVPPVEVVQDELRRVTVDDPPFTLTIAVPRIDGLADPTVSELANQHLLDVVTRVEQAFVRDATEHIAVVAPEPGPISFLEMFFEIGAVDPQFVSLHFDETSFFQGAAGLTRSVHTTTIDLNTGDILFLKDMFTGTEWAFALDFVVRQAVADTYYQGDLSGLDAWVDPDDLLIPEDFALQPLAFRFWFPEIIVGAPVFQPPWVRVPYSAIGVYVDPGGPAGVLLEGAEVICATIDVFGDAQDRVFTSAVGSTDQSEALGELLGWASDLQVSRPDLAGVVDALAGWATSYAENSATELTAADRDAIEASNDIMRSELDLCS